MVFIPQVVGSVLSLQATLSAATADTSLTQGTIGPHHPITCTGLLELDDDGTMRCPHSSAGPEVLRNQSIIDATIAIMIIEDAVKKFG